MNKLIWKNSEYDIPIRILEYLGYKDGQHWFLAESKIGKTGIPASEIYFVSNI